MLKQKFLIQFGSTFFVQAITMAAGIFVARFAGPEVVGTIAFGTAYVSIWSFINGLFSTGHIKMISEGNKLGNCVKVYNVLQGSSILIYFILVCSWFFFQKYVIRYEFESTAQQIVIFFLLFANMASLILDFNNITFTACLQQAKANYPAFIKNILLQIGRVVIVILGYKAVALAGWTFAISILTLPLAWKLYKNLPGGKFDKELALKYWHYVPPILIIVVINNILNYSDKLLLSHYTNVTELGYYSAAFAIGGVFLLISRSTGQIFFPLFSSLIKSGDWENVKEKISAYQNFSTLFIFPLVCTLVLTGGPFLIFILGIKYLPSVLPFKILLLATYISIIGVPYSNIIEGMGRFYLVAAINLFQLVIFLISIVLLISPAYLNLGAVGLAINLLLINSISNLVFVLVIFRFVKLNYGKVAFLRYLVVVGSALLVHFTIIKINNSSLLLNFIAAAVFLLLVYSMLISLNLIGKKEIKRLLSIVNPKNTVSYIRDELKEKNSE